MEAFKILFTTSTGLMSLGVIVFIIGMAWFFARMFSRKMREDAAAAKAAAGNRPASQTGSH
jgi:heme/copper-type cytochrome/quinol oxidase subunit 2